jgi:site-specific DNA-methyltransferase (cytosine-N4-specific)
MLDYVTGTLSAKGGAAGAPLFAPESPACLLAAQPHYLTTFGAAYVGDAIALMEQLPSGSVDLIVTSPPYALHFKKAYGNADKAAYVDWFRPFAEQMRRVLKEDGSLVLNIGGSYNAGTPTRSLYHFRVLLMLCDQIGFHLAQECFWHNPAKLPSPAEWVTVRRIRIKDAVEYIWWLSKSPFPKADNRQVLTKYSPDMVRLIQRGYRVKDRPSGHKITAKFRRDHGGAIPSNIIQRGNNESNSKRCIQVGQKPHPARFPAAIPEFYIRLLTGENAIVLDPFAGSNMTGFVAEQMARRWLAFELDEHYVANSALRFANATRHDARTGG